MTLLSSSLFSSSGLKTLTIPETVTSVGSGAFDNTSTTCVAVLNSAIGDSVNAANKYTGPTARCLDSNYVNCDTTNTYVFNNNSNPDTCLVDEYVYMYYEDNGIKYVTYPCP